MKVGKSKYIILFISMLVLLAITICIVLSNKSMEIDPIVNKILDLEKVSNCKITSLADYSNISIYLENPEITKEDIDTYIKARLEGYGNIELTDEFVQTNLGYETVLEYKHMMTERLTEQNKIALIMESREEVLEQLLENSKFLVYFLNFPEFTGFPAHQHLCNLHFSLIFSLVRKL